MLEFTPNPLINVWLADVYMYIDMLWFNCTKIDLPYLCVLTWHPFFITLFGLKHLALYFNVFLGSKCLDDTIHEKTVFLTKCQREIVRNCIDI